MGFRSTINNNKPLLTPPSNACVSVCSDSREERKRAFLQKFLLSCPPTSFFCILRKKKKRKKTSQRDRAKNIQLFFSLFLFFIFFSLHTHTQFSLSLSLFPSKVGRKGKNSFLVYDTKKKKKTFNSLRAPVTRCLLTTT